MENGTVNRIQTGHEICEILKNFKNEFGRPLPKEKKRKRIEVGETRWLQRKNMKNILINGVGRNDQYCLSYRTGRLVFCQYKFQ